jgi:peptidoglycan-N-acetylglucosamine deacetylase
VTKPVLYLTFDDGPGVDTPRFLDLLGYYGIRATFFVTGNGVAANPTMAKRIVADGHAIANHSWSHANLSGLSDASVRQELASTNEIIGRTTGATAVCYRPPYGATNARVHAQAVAVGLTNTDWTTGTARNHYGLWDIDTNDWRLSLAGATWSEGAMWAELNRAEAGDTILMHDGSAARPRGLRVLSDWLATNHDRFEFRSLPGCGGTLREPALDPAHPEDWHRFQIARLYQAYFGRQPDEAGWEYWSKVFSQGRSLGEISNWFAQSSEFATVGSLGDADVVNFVYRHVLEREPDPDGADYWVGQLSHGLTRGQLVVEFSESDENLVSTLAAITGDCDNRIVAESYRCLAQRLPAYHW